VSDSEAKQQASASGREGSGEPALGELNVAPGDVLAGKFRVERILGAGGMGVVVEARHVDLDDRVAIKLLLPAALERSDLVARFRREARAAVRIKSEHSARVIDVGSLEDGAPYIVMEYLEGYDLSKPTKNHGRLPIATVVDYLLQASEAIAEAHSMGIVHRDIKPPNLFLTHRADGSECIKILDFGISKVVNALDAPGAEAPEATLTQTTIVLGSPRYMAPEQISKPKSVDARADIWGIGATFYRLVTGYPPFEGNTLPEIFAAILMTPEGPPPLSQYCPDASAELHAVIRRCLHVNPDDRFQTLDELASALAPFGSKGALVSAARIHAILENAPPMASAKTPLPGGSSASPVSSSGANMTAKTVSTTVLVKTGAAPPNRVLYAVVAVLSLLLIGLAGFLFFVKGSKPGATASPAVSVEMAVPSAASPSVGSVAALPPQPSAVPSVSVPSVSTTGRSVSAKPSSGPAKAKASADPGNDDLFDQRN